MCIAAPTDKNKHDLNMACLIKWKKANIGSPIDSLNIINLSCLRVERATIFLLSIDTTAVIDDITKDTTLTSASATKDGLSIQEDICKSKKTPAVTRVDECTSLDTGVGAAIASGSQDINGNIALLVIAAEKIKALANINIPPGVGPSLTIFKENTINKTIKTSPTRFLSTVIRPPELEDGFK